MKCAAILLGVTIKLGLAILPFTKGVNNSGRKVRNLNAAPTQTDVVSLTQYLKQMLP